MVTPVEKRKAAAHLVDANGMCGQRALAKAKSEIQRVVIAIAKGTISDDEASALLNPVRTEIKTIEAEHRFPRPRVRGWHGTFGGAPIKPGCFSSPGPAARSGCGSAAGLAA